MRVCQRQRRHLCESLRGWLLAPPFTRAFLKSPSSRGLSAIAELLVAFDVLFGKFGRCASEEVIVCWAAEIEMLTSLTLRLTILPLSKSQHESLDFAIDSD